MAFWRYIKTFLRGQTPEPASPSHVGKSELTSELETTPESESAARSLVNTEGRQVKPATTPPAKLTLYFSGWGYDERLIGGEKRYYGKRTELIEAGEQIFEMRMIHECILFRVYGDTDERACLFLRHNSKRPWEYYYTQQQEFARTYARLEYGRCLLYIADVMTPQQCEYLYFDPDGSGFAQDENWALMASCQWREATPLSWPELLAADPEQLRPLCKHLFDTQINPRSHNPYIDPSRFEQIPHQFSTGSEEELRLLTVAIVQTESDLFKENLEPVTITYRAQTPTKRAGTTRIVQAKTQLTSGRITSLCDLALRLNTFAGVEWKPLFPSSTRLRHWEKHVHKVRVTVHPPSAHERAESLLVLAEWLEGKVREEKRLRLLGVYE